MLWRTFSYAIALTVIALAPSAASSADMLVPPFGANISGGPSGGAFSAPDEGLNGTGWSSWYLVLGTDDGAVITALDIRLEGPLHQRWADTDFDGIPEPTPLGPGPNTRGDSHLVLTAGALIGSAPEEDNNAHPDITSPLPDGAFDYGVGTFMAGAWGIPGASQTTTTPIAMITIPPRQNVNLIYDVSTSTGRFTGAMPVFYPPEPATVMMLSCGAPCLVSLRRRRGR